MNESEYLVKSSMMIVNLHTQIGFHGQKEKSTYFFLIFIAWTLPFFIVKQLKIK